MVQGTILWPLIFILFDVVSCLNHVDISMFVDDCVLAYVSRNNWNMYIIQNKLQFDLNAFVKWTIFFLAIGTAFRKLEIRYP